MGLFIRPRTSILRLAASAATAENEDRTGTRRSGPNRVNPSLTQVAAPGMNIAPELERLAALYRSGVLSEAEFAVAKSRLLGA